MLKTENFKKFQEISKNPNSAESPRSTLNLTMANLSNGLSLDYADLLAQCRNRQNKFMIIHEYTSLEPICGQKWSNSWSSTFMHFEQRLNYKFNFKCMFNDFQDF